LTSAFNQINLNYIRAAIEAATGIHLSLEKTRQYLIEEKMLTPRQARFEATVFRGYSELFNCRRSGLNAEDISETSQDLFAIEVKEDFVSLEDEIGRENLRGWKGLGQEDV
jgi:hypothetical protein